MSHDKRILDCRGMPCPKPVLETRRAIQALSEGSLTVLVDNLAAKENVSRAMVEAGHHVLAEETPDGWTLTVTKGQSASSVQVCQPVSNRTVVFAGDRGFGRSDPELGNILMRAFLTTVADLAHPPHTIVLTQGGVRLACEGSPVLEQLTVLESKGVELLVCGTCLDYFGLMDKLQVGRISNMSEIVGRLMEAERIIPL